MRRRGQDHDAARNTLTQLKRLLGKKYDDEEVQEDLKNLLFPVKKGENGEVVLSMQYMGETREFALEQRAAAILADLKLRGGER